MSDPTVHERIACALETIAATFAVHEIKTCRLLSIERFGVFENTPEQKGVGGFWRLTFCDVAEARTFDVDLFVKHPTNDHETARGRMLLKALGKALGVCNGYTDDIVGRYFRLEFVGTRVVDFLRTPDELCLEARKLPPVDDLSDILADPENLMRRLQKQPHD
jgi:hypothetical protein